MKALKSPFIDGHPEGSGALAALADLIALRHRATQCTLPVNRIATNPMSGQLRSTQQGRGIDFSEVRLYQPGDDVRSIDWKVTARTSKTHTKIFQEERERPVMILVDQGPSLYFGTQIRFKSVAAVRLAALLGWAALDQGDRVGGIVFSHCAHREVRPRRNRKSLLRFIHDCIHFNHDLQQPSKKAEETSLADMIAATQRTARHGSLVFIISDFSGFDAETEDRLGQLGRNNEIQGIQIFDPIESDLPPPGRYTITNGQSTQEIDTASKTARSKHTQQFIDHQSSIQRAFLRCKGGFVAQAACEHPEAYLNQLIGKSGRR